VVNSSRNRYRDILPVSKTRVKLLHSPCPDVNRDYINANYVRSSLEGSRVQYIAAQAPTDESIKEFWTMVWEQNCKVVVMLTELKEKKKVLCSKYWPIENEVMSAGAFSISLAHESDDFVSGGHVITRQFSMVEEATHFERTIVHIQYTGWSDDSIPEMSSFRRFMDLYRKERTNAMSLRRGSGREASVTSNVLVHCSAGIGRTGAFIAIDILLDHIAYQVMQGPASPRVNIPKLIWEVRHQRLKLVKTMCQYEFIYSWISDCAQRADFFTEKPALEKKRPRSAGSASSFAFSFRLSEEKLTLETIAGSPRK